MEDSESSEKRRRVAAACELCKRRKVKCDGQHPCSYCVRKHLAHGCIFTSSRTRGQIRSVGNTPHNHARNRENSLDDAPVRSYSEGTSRGPEIPGNILGLATSPSPSISKGQHEGTAVPLEGRILRDAQGKFIFIGDCAPLSFLQTVRHLIASEVADVEDFPVPASRDAFIEVSRPVAAHDTQQINIVPEGKNSKLPQSFPNG